MKKKPSLVIIGGGIVGITIAREAVNSGKFSQITIIDKEKELGTHATTRNSGVIHAGFYYTPETNKAKFCSQANKLMRNYCNKYSIPIFKCGKVVVSKNEAEDEILEKLYLRGKTNGCNLNLLSKDKLINYEPSALTNKNFLWSPNTWSASPKDLLKCLKKELKEKKVNFFLERRIISINDNYIISNLKEKINYDFLINSAGGYSLEIAKFAGLDLNYKILPFKGLYLKSSRKLKFFKRHIYPVPNIEQPFLGIHTTLTSDRFLKLGPTAIPVFSPENYKFFEGIDFKLFPEIINLQISLILKNDFGFRDLALKEIKYIIKHNIINEAQKLTSINLKEIDFDWYSPGVRAQLFDIKKRKLEMDFLLLNKGNQFHLLNSISPAWTCSFKTSKYIVEKLKNII